MGEIYKVSNVNTFSNYKKRYVSVRLDLKIEYFTILKLVWKFQSKIISINWQLVFFFGLKWILKKDFFN